ncbi:MAG: hypothetical protein A2X46_03055 [Lentisphaerae bacterium GWF2_57_35]|nr:MAG: hypothetical protein A2X46_03055 [Lentisphaerae bacterium GWF2_57_35]
MRESEERCRQLVILSPVGITVSQDGLIVFINPAGLEIMGARDESQLVNTPIMELVHPDDRARIQKKADHLRNGLRSMIMMETRIMRLDGRIITVEGRATLITYNGKPAVQSIITDITERKEVEEAQRKEIDFAYNLVQALPAFFAAISHDNRVILMNAAMLGSLGYRLEEVVGMDFLTQFVPAAEREAAAASFKKMLDYHQPLLSESSLLRRDGHELVVEWHGRPVLKENGEIDYFFVVGVDLTERRRAEEERKRLEVQIQRAQKLESLGVLAGGIAHDFNNILVNILGNADLALLDLAADSLVRPRLEDIKKAGLRASELSNQMLAYSGKGRFLVQRHNLNKLVEDMVNLLKVSVSKKAVIKYHFTDNLPPIEADSAQIRQVIMNLITNASEAIGDKDGLITISTGLADVDGHYLAETYLHDDLPAGRYIYLDIADNGSGMDAQTKAKLFDPFFTTKFIGRGLGLAAVLGIVRGHRGAIKVLSELGRGTTFRVLFPCSDMLVEVEPDNEPASKVEWAGSGTILVVDDEDGVRMVLRMMLERFGFTVLTAADGLDAINVYSEDPDGISAVILDLSMPHMSGQEVFRSLREINPDVRVILSSGYTAEHARSQFLDLLPDGFVQKPYVTHALLSAVRTALQAGA